MTILVYTLYGLSVLTVVLYTLTLIHLILIDRFKKKETKLRSWDEWPTVTVQLPIYNEFLIVNELVDSMINLDYPKDKLEIQVIDDSTDETLEISRACVEKYKNLGYDIVLIHRDNRAGFKGGALKEATPLAKGEFIAIFDADFRPNPNFLKKMLPHFDLENVGCVQAKWGHINGWDNFFTKAQMLSMDVFFVVEQEARSKKDYYLRFNGSGGIWRKACIEDAGGWSGETLSEDLDLAFRAQKKGWGFRYNKDIECPAEIPKTFHDLKKQRYRWAYGKVQVIKKLFWPMMKVKMRPSTKLHLIADFFNLAAAISVNIMAFLSVPAMILMPFDDETFSTMWKVFTLGVIYTPVSLVMVYFSFYYYYNSKSRSFWEMIKIFPIFSVIFIRITWEEAIAVFDQLRGKKVGFKRTAKYHSSTGFKAENFSKYFNAKSYRGLIFDAIVILYFTYAVYIDLTVVPYFIAFHFLVLTSFVYSFITSAMELGKAAKKDKDQNLKKERRVSAVV